MVYKHSFIICFILAISFAFSFSDTPPSYPLICKNLYKGISGVGWTQVGDVGGGQKSFRLKFTRGDRSYAAYNGFMPEGTCTWMDRGVGAGEPEIIEYRSNAPMTCMATSRPRYGCYIQGDHDQSSIEMAILNLGDGDFVGTKTFNVYNDGNGKMIVTSLA